MCTISYLGGYVVAYIHPVPPPPNSHISSLTLTHIQDPETRIIIIASYAVHARQLLCKVQDKL